MAEAGQVCICRNEGGCGALPGNGGETGKVGGSVVVVVSERDLGG